MWAAQISQPAQVLVMLLHSVQIVMAIHTTSEQHEAEHMPTPTLGKCALIDSHEPVENQQH